MSELIYLYVEQIYSKIKKQSMNLSNNFITSYDKEGLTIQKKTNGLPKNFWGENISNMSLIIGKNGMGKSSLLDLISYGKKNRAKLMPRTQFFQIYHLEDDLFYFDGSEALKKKIFGNILPNRNNFFFKIENKNSFKVLSKKERFVVHIEYNRVNPQLDWIDSNNPVAETEKIISRQLNTQIEVSDVLEFLYTQRTAFDTENMIVNIKQNRRYTRESADILYCLYQGDCSDICNEKDNNKVNSISKNINKRLNLEFGQSIYTRKVQDERYQIYEKKYFILRLLEKEVIDKIKKSRYESEIWGYIFSFKEKLKFDDHISLQEELYYEKSYYEISQRKIVFLIEILNYLQKLQDRAKPNNCDDMNGFQKNDELNYYTDLVRKLDSIEDEFYINVNTLSFPLIKVKNTKNSLISYLSVIHKTMFQMKFDNLSDGEKIYINTFMKIKKAVKTNNEVLLVLDEPDLNLHPEWSRIFVQNLVRLIKENNKGNVQVIMSSHSPFLLTDFPKENIYFIENTEHEKSKIIRQADKSFAGNLYDIAMDSFFMEFPMGEFVRSKLNNLKNLTYDEKVEIVKLVDDEMLKNILIDSYKLTELNNRSKKV